MEQEQRPAAAASRRARGEPGDFLELCRGFDAVEHGEESRHYQFGLMPAALTSSGSA
jgi:hypothetical protein